MSPPDLRAFAAVIDQPFDASIGDAALVLVLAEALPLPVRGPSDIAREPFSLLFRGPPAPLLPQGIHRLANEVLDSLDLFLVPIGLDADGATYQAVFN